jgi:ATP-dependent Lhr-like helicase
MSFMLLLVQSGVQLLSLLNRIDHVLGCQVNPIPRVALSATLGELEKVPEMLRPDKRLPCVTVTDSNSMATLQVQVKGYLERVIQNEEELQSSAEHDVCADILDFAVAILIWSLNSRKRTESIAATLSDMCEEQIVPNEFFPTMVPLPRNYVRCLNLVFRKEICPQQLFVQ